MSAFTEIPVFNPYKFYVYRNAAQTPGVNGVILYDTKVYDTGSNVDIVTNKGRFTATAAGYYWLCGAVALSYGGSGNIYSVALWKNGVSTGGVTGTQVLSTGSQTIVSQVSGLLSLAANDYIEVVSQGTSTTVSTGATTTYFMGCLISLN